MSLTFLSKILKKVNSVGSARGIIYNKYVLYVVFIIALVNLLNSVVNQDYLYCILFVLIGFLIAFFNKNMTVILVLTIAFATILNMIIKGTGMKVEGFDDSKKEKFVEGSTSNKLVGGNVNLEESEANNSESSSKASPTESVSIKATKSPSPSPKVLMENLKEQALDLQAAQKEIISGFQQIEPHMQRAEGLIGSIQETAKTIQGMKTINAST